MPDLPTPPPETGATTENPGAETAPGQDILQGVQAMLTEFTAHFTAELKAESGRRKKLVEDMADLRRKVRSSGAAAESEGQDGGAAPVAMAADPLLAWKLQAAIDGLPEGARKSAKEAVSQAIEAGEDPASVLQSLSMAQKLGVGATATPPKEAGQTPPPPPPPPGHGGTPPDEASGPPIKTWDEYRERFAGKPAEAALFLQRHPDLEPVELPGSPARRDQ